MLIYRLLSLCCDIMVSKYANIIYGLKNSRGIIIAVSKSEKFGSYRVRGFLSFTSNFAAK